MKHILTVAALLALSACEVPHQPTNKRQAFIHCIEAGAPNDGKHDPTECAAAVTEIYGNAL